MISPYVRLAHDYRPAQPLAISYSWINDHALHYFQTGDGMYEISGERYPIRPNTVFLVPPGIPFSISAAPDAEMHMLNIHFDLVERSDSAALVWPYPNSGEKRDFSEDERLNTSNLLSNSLASRTVIPDPVVYEGLFYRVHRLFGPTDFASSLQIKGAMLDLLAYLFRILQQKNKAVAWGRHERAMTAAMQYVQAHFQEPIHLEDVARAFPTPICAEVRVNSKKSCFLSKTAACESVILVRKSTEGE